MPAESSPPRWSSEEWRCGGGGGGTPSSCEAVVRAHAPGRVNLIGDHTDYAGGLVLPMAIDLGTTVSLRRGGSAVRLVSDSEAVAAVVPVDVERPDLLRPAWARYVGGVVAELGRSGPMSGAEGTVTTTLPVGAGLSSSAALEVAVALALGATGTDLEIALLCRRAEERASGVPCGVMDQLACCAGVEGAALLIDCRQLTVDPVPLPTEVAILVVDSGQRRGLTDTAYAERRAECERAEALIGPLRDATLDDVERIDDRRLRRRARHVVTENARVSAFATALRSADLAAAGQLMNQSHASLRDDFEVSSPALERVVAPLQGSADVLGARLTGAGFGGYAVAMVRTGAEVAGRQVRPSRGARVL